MTRMNPVYMDNNATTPVRPEVAEVINRYLGPAFGNPNSIHRFGRKARSAVEVAREHAANLIGALSPEEIIFTSGGTESDNWALRGAVSAAGGGGHIVTSAIEHSAILDTCEVLEKSGVEITYISPDRKGLVSAGEVAAAIRPDTRIVSIMWANNEVGTVQPIENIGALCRDKGILFHTDAVQGIGKLSIDVNLACVDLLSASGHKINASKGVGFLYIRNGIYIDPIITGGGQERDLRSGTENVPSIAGFGEACRIAKKEQPSESEKIASIRDRMENEICERIPDVVINGDPDNRVPGTSNLGFLGAEGETLLIRLDLEGFAVSTGSACSSGSTEPSHVLLAMGLPKDAVQGSLRFSLGWGSTEDDVNRLLEILPKAVERVRSIAPRVRAASGS